MEQIILALDQSSRITGWAIFNGNKLVDYGKFTLDDDNVGIRLTKFRFEITKLINTYHPHEVVLEEIQEQNNILTFKVLAQVQGVLIELLNFLNIPYNIIASTTWKSTLGIKGRIRAEQKKNAQEYINKKYDIKVAQDIADAICIGDCHLLKYNCAW